MKVVKNINIPGRIASLLLCLCLVFTALPAPAAAGGMSETPAEAAAATAGYYIDIQNRTLGSFWEALALFGAGEAIADGTWVLPVSEVADGTSASSLAPAILNELAKGNRPGDWIESLASLQAGDGSFPGGTNAHVFSMIALDAAGADYDVETALIYLADRQTAGGGFGWSDGIDPDADMTGMALVAAGRHANEAADDALEAIADPIVDGAVAFLDGLQIASGGFAGAYGNNANTDAAAVIGLVAAGEDPLSAAWTTDDGNTPLDSLLAYRTPDCGFGWNNNSVTNAYATQQVLVALSDMAAGESTFYRLSGQDFSMPALYFSNGATVVETGDAVELDLIAAGFAAGGTPAFVTDASLSVEPNSAQEEVVAYIDDSGHVTADFPESGIYRLNAEALLDDGSGSIPMLASIEIRVSDPVAADTFSIGIRIEGAAGTVARATSFEVTDDVGLSPAEAAGQFLDSRGISYFMDYSWGAPFIVSIDGEASGLFGGWDGWMYAVNGDMNTGSVQAGDDVLIFYGNWPDGSPTGTYIPIVEADTGSYELGEPLTIHLTAQYASTVYDDDWNPISTERITIDLVDVDAAIGDWTGVTDEGGLVTIPASSIKAGSNTVLFSKENDGAAPGIVRTAMKFTAADASGGTADDDTAKLIVKGLGGTRIYSKDIVLKSKDTALSALLDQSALDVVVTGSAGSRYVVSIDGLAEFDHGPESGWMYEVDGDAPGVPADTYEVAGASRIEWLYTADLGEDIGAGSGGPAAVAADGAHGSQPAAGVLEAAASYIMAQGIQDEFDILVLLADGRLQSMTGAQDHIIKHVRENNSAFRKSTDLSKMIIVAAAAGMDLADVGGYDLTDALFGFPDIEKQGVNAPAFALIAYKAAGLEPGIDSVNTHAALIDSILSFQNADGGFALAKGGVSDPDLTAMALTALAAYKDQPDPAAAIGRAIRWLSQKQEDDGGFLQGGSSSSESVSQVIIALTALGIDLKDPRFVKDEGDLLSALLSFQNSDGGFAHIPGGPSDPMATRQAAMALVSLNVGKPIYFIENVDTTMPSYDDLAGFGWALEAIAALSRDGILAGFGDGTFRPAVSVSREQFVKMLLAGLYPQAGDAAPTFSDVPAGAWYAGVVGAAEKAGIVGGNGFGTFGTGMAITRQDLAVMADRAATLAGLRLDGSLGTPAAFSDAAEISDYAKNSVSRLCAAGILTGKDDGSFDPKAACTRAEAAVVLHRLLSAAL